MDGKLLGVGSLLVQEPVEGEKIDANMFVPVDLLLPILDDLCSKGRVARSSRPWLGLYATELEGQLVVGWIAPDGPAARAGVQARRSCDRSGRTKSGWTVGSVPQGLAPRAGGHGSSAHACTRAVTLARAAPVHGSGSVAEEASASLRHSCPCRHSGDKAKPTVWISGRPRHWGAGLNYLDARVSPSRRSSLVTSTDGATCSARESLQSTVIVGEWIPHSIWLMYVRSTLDFVDSTDCDQPRDETVLSQHFAEMATDQIFTNERRRLHSPHGTIPSVPQWSG